MAQQERKLVEVPPTIAVRDLAERLGISPVVLLKALIANGIMASITQTIDFDTAAIVAEDLGFQLHEEGKPFAPEPAAPASGAEEEAAEPEAPAAGPPWYLVDEVAEALHERPPVVTVMGHVDHGKTSLLDAIRNTRVAAGESGGITQHVGAYTVNRNGHQITFIDTPGHEAFTAMRARGAQATDIAIVVVAADDGVMPQTREALDHARAAGVPVIVAVTKVDLSNARPDRAVEQIAQLGLTPETWGGDTFCINVSSVSGEGLDDLLDAIVLVAEAHPPQANPDRPALGVVLEGEIEQQRGVIASLLVQSGTLKAGDTVVIDRQYARVRAMFDEDGRRIPSAGPSTPVEIMGLSEVPTAGSRFRVVKNEKAAKALVAGQQEAGPRPARGGDEPPMTLEDLFEQSRRGEVKSLNLIVKTDVQGTVEPVVTALNRLTGTVQVNILRAAAGDISEGDVNLAVASRAVIIGFRVSPDPAAQRAAASQRVEIREYDVIYHMIDEVRDALTGMLEPEYVEKSLGVAEVRAIFSIPRGGKIAGCAVLSGTIRRSATVRVLRDGEEIAQSAVSSLKRFTEDVREVREGFECGVGLAAFDAFQEGDRLEFFARERVR